MRSPRFGRRRLLQAVSLGAVALGGLAGGTYWGVAQAATRSRQLLAQRLTELLRSSEFARQIGRNYLWQRTPTPTRAELASAIVPPAEQDAALGLERWDLRQYVRDAVEDDFSNVRLVPIGGWMLAETEAALCALTVDPTDD